MPILLWDAVSIPLDTNEMTAFARPTGPHRTQGWLTMSNNYANAFINNGLLQNIIVEMRLHRGYYLNAHRQEQLIGMLPLEAQALTAYGYRFLSGHLDQQVLIID